MANKIVHYRTSDEVKSLLADCASILLVGDEFHEIWDFISDHFDLGKLADQVKNESQDGSAKDTCGFKKIDWRDISVKITPQKFDCVIANRNDALNEYSNFTRLIDTVSIYAKKLVVIVVKNGQIPVRIKLENHEPSAKKIEMVDQLRTDGFHVYGLSGLKQLRLTNKKGWRLSSAWNTWWTKRTQTITLNHPRQSFRLIGIKKPNENFSFYYKGYRHEMSAYVPKCAKRILDIGCGAGNFGEALKEESKREVWGIEYSEKAASIAAKKLDKVIQADITQAISDLPENYFDCIVFNDVLEHLVDPCSILASVKNLLSQRGIIVASIPNVRHISVIKDLLIQKDWKYQNQGVLDKTHLRFFTKKSIARMFSNAGYTCEQLEGINSEITLSYLLLNLLLLGRALDARFTQYSCTAKPKKQSNSSPKIN